MYKFIQKNQKKFLAIFGVLLMIVFILPTSFKNSNMSRGDLTIGTVDGEKITGNELGQAKNDLEFLYHKEFLPLFELGNGPDPRTSGKVYTKYFRGDDGALAYLLLQKEAEKEGFTVSPQAADEMVASVFKGEPFTQEQLEQITPAVGRFMLVQGAFERASQSAKVSKPLVQYYEAEWYQRTKLNLVEYSAADLVNSVPPPTPEQIRQQYDQYGDQFPGSSFLTTQPAMPGYKVPDRVKLQYLELPHAAVVESVLNELSPDELYRFDRDTGYPYYEKNQSEFAVPPPPASLPSTAPTTASQPASLPGPSTATAAPTTKPFPEVAAEIRQRILTDAALSSTEQAVALRGRVAAREKQLRTALRDELGRAYAEWAAARGGDSAATQPAATQAAATQPVLPTSNPLAAIYPDLDFLTAFADQFEARYKVRPLVTSLANKWLTQDDLRSQPDIKSANAGEMPFAEYALHDLVAPAPATRTVFGPPAPTTAPATTNPTTTPTTTTPALVTSWHPIGTGLRPFEPSSLLEDASGNVFIFRLTAFEPAHRPPLADVEPEIVKQLKLTSAYQLAHDQAAKLLVNAQFEAKLRKEQNHPDLQGLPAAAKASAKPLIEAGPFQAASLRPGQPFPGYDIEGFSDKFMFIKAVEDLAKAQTAANLHPSTLIELPEERKVLVAELGDTLLPMRAQDMFMADQTIAPLARDALQTGQFAHGPASGSDLIQDWFDLKNVIARVKYVKSK